MGNGAIRGGGDRRSGWSHEGPGPGDAGLPVHPRIVSFVGSHISPSFFHSVHNNRLKRSQRESYPKLEENKVPHK